MFQTSHLFQAFGLTRAEVYDANEPHHAFVLMTEDVAVKHATARYVPMASFLWAIGLVRIPKDLEAGQQLDIARMVVLGLIGARCLGRTGELPPLLDELFTRGFLVVETPLH